MQLHSTGNPKKSKGVTRVKKNPPNCRKATVPDRCLANAQRCCPRSTNMRRTEFERVCNRRPTICSPSRSSSGGTNETRSRKGGATEARTNGAKAKQHWERCRPKSFPSCAHPLERYSAKTPALKMPMPLEQGKQFFRKWPLQRTNTERSTINISTRQRPELSLAFQIKAKASSARQQ